MRRLYDLWVEMLMYESLPENKIIKLICEDEHLYRLFVYAANALKKRQVKLLVSKNAGREDMEEEADIVCSIMTGGQMSPSCSNIDYIVVIPLVYGVDPEESLAYTSWEEYRETFQKDQEWLCAGELLCRIFRLMAERKPSGRFSIKAEMLTVDDGTYMVWRTMHKSGFFYFDNTYDGRLQQLQQCQLACLDEFDRICRENHIEYFLAGGTLLGAVRHQNIIPWDDDIDVMMLREEYEKFVSVVEKSIHKDFYYQSNRTDPDYHSIFDKIRMNHTVFKTEFSQRFEHMHQGVFIDIFVHDKTSDYRFGQQIHVLMTLFARSMVFHKWEGTDMHFYGKMKALCRIMTWYKNCTTMKKLECIQYKVVTWFRKRKTSWLYDGTGEHLRHGAFPSSWLESSRTGMLNGKEYPIPIEAEKYLAYSYGENYMQMPAPQSRKATHPVVELKLLQQ